MVRPLPLKFAVIGNSSSGKTSLLLSFIKGKFPDESMINSIETLAKVVTVDEQRFNVTIVDSNGSEKHDRIRPMSYYYPKVDVFLICFSITDRQSHENIPTKWLLEVQQHCPTAHLLIIGTKSDLKSNVKDETIVTESEGLRLAERVNAAGFMECSAKTGYNVKEAIETAINISKIKYLTKDARNR